MTKPLWRITYTHSVHGAGYYKFVRAWTKRGAISSGRIYKHIDWSMSVERWPPE